MGIDGQFCLGIPRRVVCLSPSNSSVVEASVSGGLFGLPGYSSFCSLTFARDSSLFCRERLRFDVKVDFCLCTSRQYASLKFWEMLSAG